MKKVYLLGLTLASFTLANAQTTVIDDDFESYPLGGYFGDHWDNWTLNDNDSFNIIVTNEQAASGEKSGLVGPANESNGQDVLLVAPEVYSSGIVTAEWKMLIPEGRIGYYNLQETDVPGTSFGFQCYIDVFDTLGDGTDMSNQLVWTFSVNDTAYLYATAPLPPSGQWFTLKHVMDFDQDKINIYVNGTEVSYFQTEWVNNWPGELKTFGAFDFFSYSEEDNADLVNTFYIDDVKITTQPSTGINDIVKSSNRVSVYPNPSSDYIHISVKDEMINTVEVYNMAGQRVLTSNANATTVNLDIKGLAAGVYTAKVTTKGTTYSKEFVVK